MQKISVIIPTYNESENLSQLLPMLGWADEILIVDSLSQDNGPEIAGQFGAKVYSRPFISHSDQKNWIIPQAANDWILLLDADERPDQILIDEIKGLLMLEVANHDAYWIRRRNVFMGKEIRYSGWQRDKVIRFFRRDLCRYDGKAVHEEIICDGRVGMLQGRLIHYTCKNIFDYLEKWDRYTTVNARELAGKNIKPGFYHLWIKPAYRFLSDFLIKGGILDGKTGFIVCKLSAMSVFMKYLKTDQLIRDEKR